MVFESKIRTPIKKEDKNMIATLTIDITVTEAI